MEFVLHHASPTQLVATSSHLVVRIIDGHRTVRRDYDRVEEVVRANFADTSTIGVLQILCHGNEVPPPDVHRRGAELLDSYGDRACVVIVLLGLGFWASTLRAILARFVTVLERSTIHVEGSIEAAAQRLARELVGLDAAEIVEACERLQAHMRSLQL